LKANVKYSLKFKLCEAYLRQVVQILWSIAPLRYVHLERIDFCVQVVDKLTLLVASESRNCIRLYGLKGLRKCMGSHQTQHRPERYDRDRTVSYHMACQGPNFRPQKVACLTTFFWCLVLMNSRQLRRQIGLFTSK
jgi:hypothetical protein